MKLTKNAKMFLILSVLLAFINSLPNDFIFDDIPMVQNSLNVVKAEFWDLISSYRPLRYMTYALDYYIFGMHPWGFRLMNIFYHLLTVLSVSWMLEVFGLSKRAAFISALVYAIHPVHTDAVSYISGRRDVLMGLFYMLSVGWFMKFYNVTQHPSSVLSEEKGGKKAGVSWRKRVFYLFLSLLFLFLSISSKEMGATIPLVFILYIFYKDGAKLLKKRWFYIVMMSSLLLFSFFVFFAISSGGSGLVSLDGVNYHGNSPEVHYLTASTIWLYYLKLVIFPLKLILDNANYPLVTEWNFKVFFSILSMFIYGWMVWKLATTSEISDKNAGDSPCTNPKKGETMVLPLHAVAFWMFFFVISLGPVLQIIPLHEIVAVHYLYVPVIAFCTIVGILYDNLKNRKKSLSGRIYGFIPTILLILLLSFFFVRTITRNFELKDHWTVFHADKKWAPLSFRGYFTLGALYVDMRFPDKAAEYYKKAEKTGSWDGNLLGNIIGYYILKGDHKAALNYYEKMMKKGEFITSQGTLNIAILYMLKSDCEKAISLASSFSPFKNQLKRVELINKCSELDFGKYEIDMQDIYHKQELMKELGLEIERKPYLIKLINSGEFSGEELCDLIHELAVVNLQSDIPEAIKYYKMERDLYLELKNPVPEIVKKSITVLEEYQHKVLVEGKYYTLAY